VAGVVGRGPGRRVLPERGLPDLDGGLLDALLYALLYALLDALLDPAPDLVPVDVELARGRADVPAVGGELAPDLLLRPSRQALAASGGRRRHRGARVVDEVLGVDRRRTKLERPVGGARHFVLQLAHVAGPRPERARLYEVDGRGEARVDGEQ